MNIIVITVVFPDTGGTGARIESGPIQRNHRHGAEMTGLDIKVLGELEVARAGESVALPPSKKTRALLAYLAVTGRPQRRERLCELFWDVPDDPRGALRWSLSKLRLILNVDGQERLSGDRNTVFFDASDVNLDFSQTRNLAPDVATLDTAQLRMLADCFQGHFPRRSSAAPLP